MPTKQLLEILTPLAKIERIKFSAAKRNIDLFNRDSLLL
jgi:hypothetical protein